MAKITFYPIGNADSSLIEFADGRLMVNDYFCPEPSTRDDDDKRAIISEELDKRSGVRQEFIGFSYP